MKYLLLMYQTDAHSQPGTPEFERSSQAWAAMAPELQEVLAGGSAPIGLAPVANATTVRAFRTTVLGPTNVGQNMRDEFTVYRTGPEGVDAAIRYGDGSWPGLQASKLFSVRFFPVCSAQFLAAHPLAQLSDLHHVPLLRHTHPLWSWPHWFHSHGLPPPANRGMMFDDSSLMLDAAAQGAGVALARDLLVERDLQSGRLVRPLAAEVESVLIAVDEHPLGVVEGPGHEEVAPAGRAVPLLGAGCVDAHELHAVLIEIVHLRLLPLLLWEPQV